MAARVRELDARARLAIGTWVVLILFTSVLASRRLEGAFASPVPVVAALAVTGVLALVSLAACALLALSAARARTARQAWVVGAVTLFPPACVGLALAPAGAAGGYTALVMLLVATGVAVVLAGQLSVFANVSARLNAQDIGSRVPPVMAVVPAVVASPALAFELDEEVDTVASDQEIESAEDEQVSQWLTRQVSEAGTDVLEGSTTACFAPGQKQATVHIPFCPPFGRVPQVSCEILSGDGARAKLAAAHTYGARLEVRLDAVASEAQVVRVGFIASAAAQADAA